MHAPSENIVSIKSGIQYQELQKTRNKSIYSVVSGNQAWF